MKVNFLKIVLQILIFSLCSASNETTTVAQVTEAPSQGGYGGVKYYEKEDKRKEFNSKKQPKCIILLEFQGQKKIINNLLTIDKLNLIEYQLKFVNYTKSPLKFTDSVEPHKWFRSASDQGLILLTLPFNHNLLSLKTLSLGTSKLGLDLIDKPANCMQMATPQEQLYSIQYALIRDFSEDGVELKWKEGVCRMVIMKVKGFAKFIHECIVFGEEGPRIDIVDGEGNMWLQILNILLLVVRVVAMAYIPCFVISVFKGIIKKNVPYIVKLKRDTYIRKKIMITSDEKIKQEYRENRKEVMNLGLITEFPQLRSLLKSEQYPLNQVMRVKFNRYDILVDYHRTLTENNVKVGLVHTLVDLFFRCKIKHLGPCLLCCQAEMMKYLFKNTCSLLWINFFRKFAAIFLIFIMPLPYYLRLAIYYCSGERDQIDARKDISYRFKLNDAFANSFVLYLTPTHPVMIAFYVLYMITGLLVSLAPRKNIKADRHQVLRRLVNSFRDLDEFSVVRVVSYAVSILTWPYFRFGILGCFIAPFYWVLAFPFMLFVCLIYSIPTFYLINRMVYYCRKAVHGKVNEEPTQPAKYQVRHSLGQKKLLAKLKVEKVVKKYKETMLSKMRTDHREPLESTSSNPVFEGIAQDITKTEPENSDSHVTCWNGLLYILTTVLCIITFCGIALIASDLVVFLVEMIIFTIMGIIVNAGYVLRHVLVSAIVLLYCFDNFFILEKKYLKMNKVIFAEVSKRIKDLDTVTSLPSFLQENRGFKAQECMQQAEYENYDTVIPVNHWMINDLVLFMDSEDTPRIPIKLFKKVCSIHVPGVPGPVYRGQLDALKQLAKVLFMVFLVVIAVMVFGEVYSISSTNQLIATVAGSFIPLLFRSFIFKQADIEVNTVTFKCHLDELIERFHQNWPIYDMVFQLDDQGPSTDPLTPDDAADFVISLPKNFKRRSNSL